MSVGKAQGLYTSELVYSYPTKLILRLARGLLSNHSLIRDLSSSLRIMGLKTIPTDRCLNSSNRFEGFQIYYNPRNSRTYFTTHY